MAVKIRLSRLGKTNRPYWRIVAVDSRKKRDGAFLENLGTYDPLNHRLERFHLDRINDWISKGAICTPTVLKLVKSSEKMMVAPAGN
jgi:small subunit ribosomal protein S16